MIEVIIPEWPRKAGRSDRLFRFTKSHSLWHVAHWVSRALIDHTLPAFLNIKGRIFCNFWKHEAILDKAQKLKCRDGKFVLDKATRKCEKFRKKQLRAEKKKMKKESENQIQE